MSRKEQCCKDRIPEILLLCFCLSPQMPQAPISWRVEASWLGQPEQSSGGTHSSALLSYYYRKHAQSHASVFMKTNQDLYF